MEKKTLLFKDYKLYLTVLVITIICERIGSVKIPAGPGTITLLPMIYAMILCLALYLFKPAKFLKEKQSQHGQLPDLHRHHAADRQDQHHQRCGHQRHHHGRPRLILPELRQPGHHHLCPARGSAAGLKRECIGMTHSVGREPNVALISERYGSDCPEFRGVMVVYVVGTVFGTIFMGAIASFLASATPISVEAYAMATGCGSAGMMTAALAPLIEMKPELEVTLTSYASISNLISTVAGLYISIFLGLPLTEKLYKILEPKLGRGKKQV